MSPLTWNPVCPVCTALTLNDLPGVANAPPMEYFVDLNPKFRDKLERKTRDMVGRGKCYLAKLVHDLSRYWSGEIDDGFFVHERYSWYSYTCGRNLWYPGVHYGAPLFDCMSFGAVHPDPLSPPFVSRTKGWLESCSKTHENCRVSNFPTPLPTRVLDVRDLQAIKLCESSGQNGQYVALSHCWGISKSFLTTTSTLAAMKEGFDLTQAPATFRDAIAVTNMLGIVYLWIDSLCIIQDNISDWQIESSKMEGVYANSHLTIVAANTDDDAKGFLTKRQHCHPLILKSAMGKSTKIYLMDMNRLAVPIDSRAWTLQEQYLSPRILKFGFKEITWSCEKGTVYESYKERHISKVFTRASLQIGEWSTIVEEYSRRGLTKDTDKLPALAGLASYAAGLTESKYCAGLWWDNMPEDLLWHRYNSSLLEMPSEYLAPSWSWASLNGWVTFIPRYRSRELPYSFKLDTVIFQDFSIQTSTENPYGQVREGGWIKLQAPLAELGKSKLLEGLYAGVRGLSTLTKFAHLQEIDESGLEARCYFDISPQRSETLSALFLTFKILSEDRDAEGNVSTKPENWRHIYGLVVKKTGQSLNSYERIGIFHVKTEQSDQALRLLENQPVKSITLY